MSNKENYALKRANEYLKDLLVEMSYDAHELELGGYLSPKILNRIDDIRVRKIRKNNYFELYLYDVYIGVLKTNTCDICDIENSSYPYHTIAVKNTVETLPGINNRYTIYQKIYPIPIIAEMVAQSDERMYQLESLVLDYKT